MTTANVAGTAREWAANRSNPERLNRKSSERFQSLDKKEVVDLALNFPSPSNLPDTPQHERKAAHPALAHLRCLSLPEAASGAWRSRHGGAAFPAEARYQAAEP
jgi:hypothetical protein